MEQPIGIDMLNGEPLAGYGAGVLQAGIADVSAGHTQGRGQAMNGWEGGHAFFFDLEEDVGTLAGEFVGGDFLDDEILGAFFDDTGDTGDVGGD